MGGVSGGSVPTWALIWVLIAVLVTGVMDGVAQPAVFMDAARAGRAYTQVTLSPGW